MSDDHDFGYDDYLREQDRIDHEVAVAQHMREREMDDDARRRGAERT